MRKQIVFDQMRVDWWKVRYELKVSLGHSHFRCFRTIFNVKLKVENTIIDV